MSKGASAGAIVPLRKTGSFEGAPDLQGTALIRSRLKDLITQMIESFGDHQISVPPFGTKMRASIALRPFLPAIFLQIDRLTEAECEQIREIARGLS